MEVIKITPRGYCHGVVHALNLVSKTIADETKPRPVYILGQIVHNQNITNAFNEAGAITIDGKNREEILSKVESGTVIITAHGINPHLITKAANRGLTIVDATCSDVYRTHNVIKEKLADNYEVLYIGKSGHPEPEGAIGINPELIHLVSNIEDLENLKLTRPKVCITNQTTMSMWDTQKLMDKAKELYPHLEVINEICLATQQRQEAVLEMAKEADITLVVGDPKSNNTNRLVQISEEMAKTVAYRINNVEDIDLNWLLNTNVNKVAVTSGASTPTIITKEVIDFIEQFDKEDETTWEHTSKLPLDRIIPRVRRNK